MDQAGASYVPRKVMSIWKMLLALPPLVEDGMRTVLRDGRNTSMLDELWVGRCKLAKWPTTINVEAPNLGATVSELIDEGSRWREERMVQLFGVELVGQVLAPSRDLTEDQGCGWLGFDGQSSSERGVQKSHK